MKNCTNPKCGLLKPFTEFHKDKSSRDGLRSRCKDCCRSYYPDHKEEMDAWQSTYQAGRKEENVAYQAERYRNDKEGIMARQRAYKLAHKEEVEAIRIAWRRANRGSRNALEAKRQISKIQATPKNLTKDQLLEIDKIYDQTVKISAETGILHHVDHIVPIQGKNVSGLHVPWNLQTLTAADNSKKKNSFDFTYDNLSWSKNSQSLHYEQNLHSPRSSHHGPKEG